MILEANRLPSEDLCTRQLEDILRRFEESAEGLQDLFEWMDVFSRLKSMLASHIAGMRDRPRLEIVVINRDSDSRGAVYGEAPTRAPGTPRISFCPPPSPAARTAAGSTFSPVSAGARRRPLP